MDAIPHLYNIYLFMGITKDLNKLTHCLFGRIPKKRLKKIKEKIRASFRRFCKGKKSMERSFMVKNKGTLIKNIVLKFLKEKGYPESKQELKNLKLNLKV